MAQRPKRPRREKKSDHFISPDAKAAESKLHSTLAVLDRLAGKMDQKWGVDKLVELQKPDTDLAARYGSAMGRLNEAMREGNQEQVQHMVGVCCRGLAAMDKAAAEAGEQPSPLLGEYKLDDGFHIGIVAEAGDWPPIAAERPELTIFSLREIAVLLKPATVVTKIKDTFDGSDVKKTKLSTKFFNEGGDIIPFN